MPEPTTFAPFSPSHDLGRVEPASTPALPEDSRDPYYDGAHPQHDARVREVFSKFQDAHPPPHADGTPPAAPDLAGAPGVPDAADPPDLPAPFQLEAPPGALSMRYSEDVRRDIAAVAHAVGFPQDLCQQAIDAVATGHEVPVPPFGPYVGTEAAAEAQLRRAWGGAFEERCELASYAAKKLGRLPTLDRSGQSNNPAIVRGLARLGALMVADEARYDKGSPRYREFHSTDSTRRRAMAARVTRWTSFAAARLG